jgi:hypothetical protein
MRSFTRDRTQLSQVNGRLGSLCVVACTLLTISAATPSADSTTMREGTTTIQDSSLRQYRAYRRMHARNEKFGQEAWLECWTEFDERGFRYDITTERGSDYVLNKVLKTLLRREQELIAEGQTDRADLTPENYEFAEPAVDEVGQRYVTMKPKRKDVLLLDGRMVLNSEGTDVVRVEGQESVVLDQPRQCDPAVRAPRRRARAGLDRISSQTEIRRYLPNGSAVRLRDHQRTSRKPRRSPGHGVVAGEWQVSTALTSPVTLR